jgi:hypothetical protein
VIRIAQRQYLGGGGVGGGVRGDVEGPAAARPEHRCITITGLAQRQYLGEEGARGGGVKGGMLKGQQQHSP